MATVRPLKAKQLSFYKKGGGMRGIRGDLLAVREQFRNRNLYGRAGTSPFIPPIPPNAKKKELAHGKNAKN
jgi:hypothetical protein